MKARFASGSATAGQLHHVQGHDRGGGWLPSPLAAIDHGRGSETPSEQPSQMSGILVADLRSDVGDSNIGRFEQFARAVQSQLNEKPVNGSPSHGTLALTSV
jgi:hypothetical protein